MNNKLTKCSFCSYATSSGCMVTPNSHYCKKANNEYYQYLRENGQQRLVKSLRSWENKLN